MKKIFTLAAATMFAATVSAQENVTVKLDKNLVIYTTDDTKFVKYNEDDEEDQTTYYNDGCLKKALNNNGIALNGKPTGTKVNLVTTIRNNYKDEQTGFEMKAGDYRCLFIEDELNLFGELKKNNMTGFKNLKQAVLYILPTPNVFVNGVPQFFADKPGESPSGRLQVQYASEDGTQLTQKAFRDTKAKTTTLFNDTPWMNYVIVPNMLNAELPVDNSTMGYDYMHITVDQPYKLVYNLDNKHSGKELEDMGIIKDNPADYKDQTITSDGTEDVIDYYLAKKEDTSAYSDHDSANQESPIYSATGYNCFTKMWGKKIEWTPETVVQLILKRRLYIAGIALISGTEGAETQYLNTNLDGNGDLIQKKFSDTPVPAYGTVSGESGIESIQANVKTCAAIYNIAGQKVSSSYKGIVIENGVKRMK